MHGDDAFSSLVKDLAGGVAPLGPPPFSLGDVSLGLLSVLEVLEAPLPLLELLPPSLNDPLEPLLLALPS